MLHTSGRAKGMHPARHWREIFHLQHRQPNQPQHDQQRDRGQDASFQRSDRQRHGGKLEAEWLGMGKEFREQRLTRNVRPRPVAGHPHKHLVAVVAKPEAPRDPQQFGR